MSDETITRHESAELEPAPTGNGRLVVGLLLVAGGVLWLLDAIGLFDMQWRYVFPVALVVVGLALLITAARGAHGGLIALGIVLSVLVVVGGVFPGVSPVAGVGDREVRPVTASEAENIGLAVGSLTIDLRDLEEDATVRAGVGMGELLVRVPTGMGLEIRASAGMGEVVVFGRSESGVGISTTETVEGRPAVVLDLSVGMGKVEVRR
jgi:hypothetical protein